MSLVRPRVQAYLCKVSPYALSAKDMEWLDKAIRKDYHKVSKLKILNDAASGFSQIWRVGAEQGIIVTEVVVYAAERYLCANHLAMEGFFQEIEKIEECLVDYAKDMGCKAIQLETARPGLQEFYANRYKELTRVYIKEIDL